MAQQLSGFLAILFILLSTVNVEAKTASDVFETVSPSIIVVKALDAKGKAFAFGSGVVLDKGIIVTNCHVIKNAISMKVMYRGKEYTATPLKTDWDRDVCSLTVTNLYAPAIALGTTIRLKVGQKVYAVGSPKGLDLTLSDGIISSLRQLSNGQYLQITAPISPGSSGGGLFDESGLLIGLPTFYIDGGQQLNFAIPVEWIKELSQRPISASNLAKMDSISNNDDLHGIDWLNKAIALEQKNDWKSLLNHTLSWVKEDVKNATAWYSLGNAYYGLRQTAQAIEAYQQTVRIDPDYSAAWNNLGNVYRNSNQITKATEAYQQAIRNDKATFFL